MVPWKWLRISESHVGGGKTHFKDRTTDANRLKIIFLPYSFYPFKVFWNIQVSQAVLETSYSAADACWLLSSPVGHEKSIKITCRLSPEPGRA